MKLEKEIVKKTIARQRRTKLAKLKLEKSKRRQRKIMAEKEEEKQGLTTPELEEIKEKVKCVKETPIQTAEKEEVPWKKLLDIINNKFEGMNDKFESINDKFEGINDKFEGINDKFEGIQTELNAIKKGCADNTKLIVERIGRMECEMKENKADIIRIEKGLNKYKKGIEIIQVEARERQEVFENNVNAKIDDKINSECVKIMDRVEERMDNVKEEIEKASKIQYRVMCDKYRDKEDQNKNLKQTLQSEIDIIKSQINNINIGATSHVENIPLMTGSCTNSKMGMIPIFYDDYRLHPMKYLYNVKTFVDRYFMNNYEINHNKIMTIIKNTIKGDPELWFNIVENQCDTFSKFESLFKKQYWGEQQQNKTRNDLVLGRYNKRTEFDSREKYAMRLYNKAMYLEPNMTEQELLAKIANHFGEDIALQVVIKDITNLQIFFEYLRRIDETNKNTSNWQNTSVNTSYRRDNNRTDGNYRTNINNNLHNGRGNYETRYDRVERNENSGHGRYGNNRYYNNRRYEQTSRNNDQRGQRNMNRENSQERRDTQVTTQLTVEDQQVMSAQQNF